MGDPAGCAGPLGKNQQNTIIGFVLSRFFEIGLFEARGRWGTFKWGHRSMFRSKKNWKQKICTSHTLHSALSKFACKQLQPPSAKKIALRARPHQHSTSFGVAWVVGSGTKLQESTCYALQK